MLFLRFPVFRKLLSFFICNVVIFFAKRFRSWIAGLYPWKLARLSHLYAFTKYFGTPCSLLYVSAKKNCALKCPWFTAKRAYSAVFP